MHPLNFSRTLQTVVLPAIAATLAIVDSATAATFASVRSSLEFTNFSQSPSITDTGAFTDTLAISGGGSVLASSDAVAIFDISGAFAANQIESFTQGADGNYLGVAQSQASVVGVFDLDTGDTLSFDFSGFLALATAIDNSSIESAFAGGSLGFSLFEETANQTPTFFDALNIVATLSTAGDNDIFQFMVEGTPGNWTIDQFFRQTGGTEEALVLKFSGRYNRVFTKPTLVSLVEDKTGAVEVRQVPTPSLLWGIMAYGGLGIFSKRRRQ